MRRSLAGPRFADRVDAGRRLSEVLEPHLHPDEAVILGLPRGGVPVAYEVATAVGAPLDVLVVRKLGVPWQRELAFGAIATGDVVVYDPDVMSMIDLPDDQRDAVVERERGELERRERLYREGRPPLDVRDREAVVVDDGIATGSTVRAALRALALRGAARRIVACPVAPPDVVRALRREADLVVCLETPEPLMAVGFWYDNFGEVSDQDVKVLLTRAQER
ncbi:MAG TPA: phosphoribosyltransferase family protein [Longimicrobiales bacterium]|nr:phosphoribosyltransferase family protein [Longimicrobiales bacterium]